MKTVLDFNFLNKTALIRVDFNVPLDSYQKVLDNTRILSAKPTILKIIEPELVIESGVMKGFTTYLIDAATHDDCEIYSYDINFENNMFNSKKAKYINSDITNKIPLIKNKKLRCL